MSLMKTCFRGVYGYYEDFWEEGDNKGNMPYHEMLIEALEKRDLEESIKILKTDISDLKSYISLSLQSMGSIWNYTSDRASLIHINLSYGISVGSVQSAPKINLSLPKSFTICFTVFWSYSLLPSTITPFLLASPPIIVLPGKSFLPANKSRFVSS